MSFSQTSFPLVLDYGALVWLFTELLHLQNHKQRRGWSRGAGCARGSVRPNILCFWKERAGVQGVLRVKLLS